MKNILLFSYCSKESYFSFFKDLKFTNKPTHKALEFLYPLDRIDKKMQKIHAEILFIEESATIPDNLYRTIISADNIFLIYTNTSQIVKDKLIILARGKIHRKIIEEEVEQKIALQLISMMAKAYATRNRKLYHDKYEDLMSMFVNNYLQEAQLQIMHAGNSKKRLNEILTMRTPVDITELFIGSLLENIKIKDTLVRLANKALTDKKAVLKEKIHLHQVLFYDAEQAI